MNIKTSTNLTKNELISKLEDIEWEDFEVKEARSEIPKSSWETVSAFSNTAGGWLVFGVKKEGKSYEIIGVSNPDKIAEDFLNVLRSGSKFNTKLEPEAKKYDFEGKTILAFYLPQKHPREKPVYFNSPKNTFIRTGSGDRLATQEEINSFYRNSSFDEKNNELTEYNFSDLDPQTVKQYRNLFAQINPNHPYLALSNEEFFGKLGALRDGKITYGGLLVFGTEDAIQRKFTSYRIEYLEIGGISYSDAETKYDYRISSEQNLFQTFFLISTRLLKKIEVPFSVKNGIRDEDQPQVQAIREALVNLMMHADYFSKACPRIRVFTDRIEFFNPGALPKKLELIMKEGFSLPRNPVVAKIFRFVHFSENIGSGFDKMIDGWKFHYKLRPVIGGDFDYYKITFLINGTNTKTTSKTTTKLPLNDESNEERILEIIINNPSMSTEQIAGLVNLSVDGVRYHIKNLKARKRIKRKGHGRGGSWEIIKKG